MTLSDTPMKSADKVTDLPLGIDDQSGYQQLTAHLDKGDMVLCYSDAFTDARGTDGKSLGVDGMLQTVASIQHTDVQALISSLVAPIRARHSENLTQDDATIVLFRANGTLNLSATTCYRPFASSVKSPTFRKS